MLITFPSVFALDERRARNQIRQIGVPTHQAEGALTPFERGRLHGCLFRGDTGVDEALVVPKAASIPDLYQRAIAADVTNGNGAIDLRNGTWLKHPIRNGEGGLGFDHSRAIRKVLDSWVGAFSYVQEDPAAGIQGLRGPQIGAVHRVHAHWSITDAVATIVMPTGTGKTETMLSILVSARCPFAWPPTTAYGNASGAQIAARSLTAHTGRRLDPPKRPPQAPEGEDLLLFLVVQDVAHPSEGP